MLSLSNLRKYDDRPFIACVVTPTENFCLMANTTLLKKISHTSQQLRENNIRGSFNGSDIAREFEGIIDVSGETLASHHSAQELVGAEFSRCLAVAGSGSGAGLGFATA